MATSALPLVMAALLATAESGVQADVDVFLGFDLSNLDSDTSLTIGSSDVLSQSDVVASTSVQAPATLSPQRTRDQDGSVSCVAWAQRGDTDLMATLQAAYTQMAVIETALRADPTLGVGQPGRAVLQLGDESLTWSQVESGSEVLIVFTVQFKVRI